MLLIGLLYISTIQSDLEDSYLTRPVNRGTPHPKLHAYWSGAKMVAYTNDLVMFVSRIYPSVINETMKSALRKEPATRTRLILFTAKTRLPEFHLPRLNEQNWFFPPM